MKRLRILTGVHAGAEVHLGPGKYSIGADVDADIYLSDWSGCAMPLLVSEDGQVRGWRSEAEPHCSDSVTHASDERDAVPQCNDRLLTDLVPVQFCNTVFCVGPVDKPWPTDIELMSTLLAASGPRYARRDGVWSKLPGKAFGGLLCAGMVFTLLLPTMASRATLPSDSRDPASRLGQALANAHLEELHAKMAGSTVALTGMVASSAEDAQVRALLDRLVPQRVSRHYDVAQTDMRNIEDALGMKGVSVTYAGRGVFEITGVVKDRREFDVAIDRIRRDLSGNVKDIHLRVTEPESPQATVAVSEFMSSRSVRYKQTPDGVKHLYANADAASPVGGVSAADPSELQHGM